MQLFLAVLALMPWWVLVNHSIARKITPYPLVYSLHYQSR